MAERILTDADLKALAEFLREGHACVFSEEERVNIRGSIKEYGNFKQDLLKFAIRGVLVMAAIGTVATAVLMYVWKKPI